MDAFLNPNNSKNQDLRESNPRRNYDQDVVITSRFRLSQVFVFRVICILKSVHHDVVGILVPIGGCWSITALPADSSAVEIRKKIFFSPNSQFSVPSRIDFSQSQGR